MKELTTDQLRQNGMAEQAKEMQDRIMGGDCPSYDAALGIIGEYVNITGPDGPEQDYFPDMTI